MADGGRRSPKLHRCRSIDVQAIRIDDDGRQELRELILPPLRRTRSVFGGERNATTAAAGTTACCGAAGMEASVARSGVGCRTAILAVASTPQAGQRRLTVCLDRGGTARGAVASTAGGQRARTASPRGRTNMLEVTSIAGGTARLAVVSGGDDHASGDFDRRRNSPGWRWTPPGGRHHAIVRGFRDSSRREQSGWTSYRPLVSRSARPWWQCALSVPLRRRRSLNAVFSLAVAPATMRSSAHPSAGNDWRRRRLWNQAQAGEAQNRGSGSIGQRAGESRGSWCAWTLQGSKGAHSGSRRNQRRNPSIASTKPKLQGDQGSMRCCTDCAQLMNSAEDQLRRRRDPQHATRQERSARRGSASATSRVSPLPQTPPPAAACTQPPLMPGRLRRHPSARPRRWIRSSSSTALSSSRLLSGSTP